ncbi:hypothetical protein C8Q74DRAFT_1364481 [Fomes fomentarius]|nr:hypothetical protein C8Q74DRAFT_1364481 [Fomes fomentarius]
MANNNNDAIVQLNNYLQKKDQVDLLSWEDENTGLRHAPQWTSWCKIGGERMASGTGLQKNIARDDAAKKTLEILAEREGGSAVE